MYSGRKTIGRCLYCRQRLVDGAKESGFTGGVDYMTDDGDYGCDRSPDSNEAGVGSHTPDTFLAWDGHTIRVTAYEVGP